jgi:hypothetical protein
MLRAEQERLAQETNIAYVRIRQEELDYFNAFFGGFGVQAAILGGFNFCVISQSNGMSVVVSSCHTYNFVVCCAGRDAPCNPFFIWVYWINVSLGAVFGVMAILIALLTNVFGQGLALRGPLGSMV